MLICIFLPLVLQRDWFTKKEGQTIIQWWHQRTLRILGLTVVQRGKPFQSTSLVVANHISFLDISVIASLSPVTFLSKSTLRYWPVIGFIAMNIGTVFIQRNNKKAAHKITQSIATALEQRQTLVIFPEGTTTAGNTVNKFHSSLFQAAINTAKPVQPVALRYNRNGKIDTKVAYINKDNFIITLIRIMAQAKTEVHITYCHLINSRNINRAELASTSHQLISQIIAASP